jgi:hypothetical protein
MVPGISGADAAARLAQSVQSLTAILQGSQQQEMDLANKLLSVQVQQSVQDTALGAQIDAYA